MGTIQVEGAGLGAIHDIKMELVQRMKEIQEFDNSKTGVKGLLDSGITTIPSIFIHSLSPQRDSKQPPPSSSAKCDIPVIDLSCLYSNQERRAQIVNEIKEAASTWGFFQIINHGISKSIIEEAILAVRSFHEQPIDIKKCYYGRGLDICYLSNSDLFISKAASWRDTFKLVLGPNKPELESIPSVCRKELTLWDQHATGIGELLMELLSEGMGVNTGRLKDLSCLESRILLGQFYPYCPQPDLTVGIVPHTDQSILSVVVQDQIGGLQVKNGEEWVDIKPIEGAIIVNVGDFLQIISNDQYKSAEHRVVANRFQNPRSSIVYFFHPGGHMGDTYSYGPLPELVSSEKPALYRNFTVSEFWKRAQGMKSAARTWLLDLKL